jgi:hypothetical protein
MRIEAAEREGRQSVEAYGYTAGFNVGSHDNIRSNLVRLRLAYARALGALEDFDKAIATLTDARMMTADLDDRWSKERAEIAYELARALAARAAANNDDTDRAEACRQLHLAVEGGAVDGTIATWEEIKGAEFGSLQGLTDYQALIRRR